MTCGLQDAGGRPGVREFSTMKSRRVRGDVICLCTSSRHTLGGRIAARGTSSTVRARACGPVPWSLALGDSYEKGDGSMKRSLVCTVFVLTLVVATAWTGWAQAPAPAPGAPPAPAPGAPPAPAPGAPPAPAPGAPPAPSGGRTIPQQELPPPSLQALTPQQQADLAELALNKQTAVACQFCFTCGGDWPVFAGYQHSSPDPGGHVQRGPACSGPLTVQPAAQDLFPFLCCK
jgi:hypothetical protein